MINTIINIGTKLEIIIPLDNMLNANPDKIKCPADVLAANLTPNEIAFIKKLAVSITTRKGANTNGTPLALIY